ncbi:MAG: Mrp/NBP35 family ATP-binding protein [Clostridia bacterium]|nr:Mrp/NBP35 family ATP-binding protein [Clostridia bacterium]MBR1685811.1 Mrp/NBP35 family ATP-binding protein [Clostridia bacterium]MBR2287766.1 Mrp/NBP35 family ATP-binding protein [Clostridia bacterium]
MSECNRDCSSCGQKCAQADFRAPMNASSRVQHVIGVVSGKGGVGKSLVTGLMATEMRRRGRNVAVLDADITGPSVPKMFGVTDKAMGNEEGILPVYSKGGIGMMSINLLLEDDTDPVVWRGSLIAGTVKQFWTDVMWGDVDYMFVDMPPGTGDVPLTVFQSLPVDGILIVTSPQELVDMIVSKAVKMAQMMNIPVLGLVENMSYMLCPDCGRKLYPFGEGKVMATAERFSLPVLAQLPIDPAIASACDAGRIEDFRQNWMDGCADVLTANLPVKA